MILYMVVTNIYLIALLSIFIFIKIQNIKHKGKIMIWLEDAIETTAYSKQVSQIWLGLRKGVKIQVTFKINGKTYKRESTAKVIRGQKGHLVAYKKYVDREIRILYSEKYDEVLILKDQDKVKKSYSVPKACSNSNEKSNQENNMKKDTKSFFGMLNIVFFLSFVGFFFTAIAVILVMLIATDVFQFGMFVLACILILLTIGIVFFVLATIGLFCKVSFSSKGIGVCTSFGKNKQEWFIEWSEAEFEITHYVKKIGPVNPDSIWIEDWKAHKQKSKEKNKLIIRFFKKTDLQEFGIDNIPQENKIHVVVKQKKHMAALKEYAPEDIFNQVIKSIEQY